MTRGEALKFGGEQLKNAGIAEAHLDAKYLLMDAAGLSSAELFFGGSEELPEDVYKKYAAAVSERAVHVPLQYITGTQEFMGLSFQVSPAVLIPRQDTECLVEAALPYCAGKSVLDLCTGSGCIILSLAKLGALRAAAGCDLSEQALAVAEKNAAALGVRAAFLQSDLFESITESYDVIVSNPPYIRTEEICGLMPEVRDYEPRMALDGDADGLRFYRKITAEAGEHLASGGMLFFEIGCDQADDVVSLMERHGFKEVTVRKDYAGLDRVVYGRVGCRSQAIEI